MSKRKASKDTDGGIDLPFLNIITVVFMYLVILIFYGKQMSSFEAEQRTLSVWMNTLEDAVGISTFTYVFPAAIQTIAVQKGHLLKSSILLLGSDVLYALLYALFIPRPCLLNGALCAATIALVIWTSRLICQTAPQAESGQAPQHIVEGGVTDEQSGNTEKRSSTVRAENDRIT